MKRQSVFVLAVLAVVLVGNKASADLYYDVIDLGTLGGSMNRATAINNYGQIIGKCGDYGGGAYFNYNGVATLLGAGDCEIFFSNKYSFFAFLVGLPFQVHRLICI